MSKHTAGPWTIDSDFIDYIVDARGLNIAGVDISTFPPSEKRANSQLIIAAPDMYKALKMATEQHPGGGSKYTSRETWDACIAAIAKAEGRS